MTLICKGFYMTLFSFLRNQERRPCCHLHANDSWIIYCSACMCKNRGYSLNSGKHC